MLSMNSIVDFGVYLPVFASDFGIMENTFVICAIGRITIAKNPEFIFMQVPFLFDYDAEGNFTFDAPVEKCQVLSLTENELRIKCTIDDTENPAKDVYSFTLTYVPAQ